MNANEPVPPPRFETLPSTRVVGMRIRTSHVENRAPELWRAFMPRRYEIPGRLHPRYLSIQVFDRAGGDPADPSTPFDRWAAVEVGDAAEPPPGMEAYTIGGGLYAVFLHRGPAAAAPRTWGFIFGQWLPASDHVVDDREHFERLPEGYRPDDPNAEEEVWIPVRPR